MAVTKKTNKQINNNNNKKKQENFPVYNVIRI